MPAFEINGLHVVNGKIEPITHELQDPNGDHAKPDAAFIVRSDIDKLFYYCEQINQLWIRARLSEGVPAEANLQFTKLIFSAEVVYTLGLHPTIVNELITPDHKLDIKNRLIRAAADFKTIDELKQAAPPATAPIIPVVEEEYTGMLSSDDRVALMTVLLASDLGKPPRPTDYEGTDEDWDNAWDKALAHALQMQYFEKIIPDSTPADIKDRVKAMIAHMNPGHINSFRFDKAANQKPMIGHVFDDIQQYFSKMFQNPARCPVNSLAKLSPAFYTIRVGNLNDGTAMVYTGLSDAQYALAINLSTDFMNFEQHLRYYTSESFAVLSDRALSIPMMEHIIALLNHDSIRTEADNRILDDFNAIVSAATIATDTTLFDARYHEYRAIVCAKLAPRASGLRTFKRALLRSADPVAYLEDIDSDECGALILSLTREDLCRLSAIPGFVTPNRLKFIFQIVEVSHFVSVIPAVVKSSSDLAEALEDMPDVFASELIETVGVERLHNMLTTHEDLGKVLKVTAKAPASSILQKLGQVKLALIMHDADALDSVLRECPEDLRLNLIKALSNDDLRMIISSAACLGLIVRDLPYIEWPAVVTKLGADHIKGLIYCGARLNTLAYKIYYYSNSTVSLMIENMIHALMSALGADIMKHIFVTSNDLSDVLRNMAVVSQSEVIKKLGCDNLSAIITNAAQLKAVLESMAGSEISRTSLVVTLTIERVLGMIKNGEELAMLLKFCSETVRISIIKKLTDDQFRFLLLQVKLPHAYETVYYKVLSTIPLNLWSSVAARLGADHLKLALSGSTALTDMLVSIASDHPGPQVIENFKSAIGLDVIKHFVCTADALYCLLYVTQVSQRADLIQMLGSEHIIGIIQNGGELSKLLGLAGEKSKAALLDLFGVNNIQALIKKDEDFFALLDIMPEATNQALITKLGDDRLRELATSQNSVATLFACSTSPSWHTDILAKLGATHIKSVIYNVSRLTNVLIFMKDDAARLSLMAALTSALGPAGMKAIIVNGIDLRFLFKHFGNKSMNALMGVLGGDHMAHIITSTDELKDTLAILEKNSQSSLIALLGVDRIQALIESGEQLCELLTVLPGETKSSLFIALGDRRLQSLLSSSFDLVQFLLSLYSWEWSTVIKMLGSVHIRKIIENDKQLVDVLDMLVDDESKLKLIDAFGPNLLADIIKNRQGLDFVQQSMGIGLRHSFVDRLSTLSSDSLRAMTANDGNDTTDVEALTESLCLSANITFAGKMIGGVLADGSLQYWPPEALMLQKIRTLEVSRLHAIICSASKLGMFFSHTSPFLWTSVITMLGSAHIKSVIKNGNGLKNVILSLDNEFDKFTLIRELKDALGDKGMKVLLSDGEQLSTLLIGFNAESRAGLFNILEPDLVAEIMGDSSQLGSVLRLLDNDSKTWLITRLRSDRLKALIKNGEELWTLIHCWGEPARNEFIAMLGPHIVDIIDRGGVPCSYDGGLEINRAYKYHSHYQMRKPFAADAINANIESIFADIASSDKHGLPFLAHSSARIAMEIINKCKEGPSPGELLSFLELKLNTVPTDGELAMRIMYCIEQLRYHTHRSDLYPVQKKEWKHALPGATIASLATAIGIGLALAFTPGLHLMIGAIIGVTLAAALITMAVYTIAVRELGAKKDFTDKGLFTSWSVFNKADAAVGANMDVGAPYHRAQM